MSILLDYRISRHFKSDKTAFRGLERDIKSPDQDGTNFVLLSEIITPGSTWVLLVMFACIYTNTFAYAFCKSPSARCLDRFM